MCIVGCTPAPIVKPVPVDVTKYVKQQIPAQLLAPCKVVEPDRACWRGTKAEFCNGQLVEMLADYKAALATCDSQISAIAGEGK